MEISYLPDTFFTKLFKRLTYNDIIILSKTPEFRDSLLRHFSHPSTFRQLEKDIILECIHDLERHMDINFHQLLLSFFVKRGYNPSNATDKKYFPKYEMIVENYLDDLIEMFRNDKSQFSKEYIEKQILDLQRRKKEKQIPYDLFERFASANVSKFYDFNQLSKKYRYEIEDIRDEIEQDDFKKIHHQLFYKKNGYDNTLQYLKEIKEYIKTQMDDDILNLLQICLDKKLENIKYIFMKSS
jgi:hypothetical protein